MECLLCSNYIFKMLVLACEVATLFLIDTGCKNDIPWPTVTGIRSKT